jgi:hypothetical protein
VGECGILGKKQSTNNACINIYFIQQFSRVIQYQQTDATKATINLQGVKQSYN